MRNIRSNTLYVVCTHVHYILLEVVHRNMLRAQCAIDVRFYLLHHRERGAGVVFGWKVYNGFRRAGRLRALCGW